MMTKTKKESKPAPQNPQMFTGNPVVIHEGVLEVNKIRKKLHPKMPWALPPSKELIDDIASYGVHTPIVIEEVDKKYWIRSGKRRFLASEQLEIYWIPCVVRKYPAGMGSAVGLSANIKRSNNPVDEYHHLLELKAYLQSTEKWVSDETLAKELGISITQYRKISCIEVMPPAVQTAINERRITVNNAYALAKLAPSRQEPLIVELEAGNRVTGTDIKEQKRAVREQAVAQVLPVIGSQNGRTDLPKLEFVEKAFAQVCKQEKISLTGEEVTVFTMFIYDLLNDPNVTLDKILGGKK